MGYFKQSIKSKKLTNPHVAIVTIWDNNNYGNRLQNYALQTILRRMSGTVLTIPDKPIYDIFLSKHFLKREVKRIIRWRASSAIRARRRHFRRFSRQYVNRPWSIYSIIPMLAKRLSVDIAIVGSDQVWNPHFGHLRKIDLLFPFQKSIKASYAASFGADDLTETELQTAVPAWKLFDALSVRETEAKKMLSAVTNRTDIEVLVDPTLLLTPEEWAKVMKRPEPAPKENFICCYFLGESNEERKQEISVVARQLNCEVLDFSDESSPAFTYGPSEFLWCIQHAQMVCTDSFHGCIFSVLFQKPLRYYKREGTLFPMMSRIQTLFDTFSLYGEPLETCLLITDYHQTEALIETERNKSFQFLDKVFDLN